MDKKLTIYGFAPSTYVRTARMACIEKGVDHDLKPLEFREESHRLLHPYLKMPVMKWGNEVVFETLAIAIFIDEQFDGPKLQPEQSLDRARMFQWVSALTSYAYDDVVKALLREKSDSGELTAALNSHFKIIDNVLNDTRYLVGNELTIADLFLAPMVDFAAERMTEKKLLEPFPQLSKWRDRIASRRSFSKTGS